MNITIRKASIEYLEDCKAALLKSDLGREYFPVEANATDTLKEGIGREEIYLALVDRDICVGFIWFIQKELFIVSHIYIL